MIRAWSRWGCGCIDSLVIWRSWGEMGVMGYVNAQGEGGGDPGNGHGRTRAWTLDDAPERYIAFLKRYVVRMEVEVTRVEGRFKVS